MQSYLFDSQLSVIKSEIVSKENNEVLFTRCIISVLLTIMTEQLSVMYQ